MLLDETPAAGASWVAISGLIISVVLALVRLYEFVRERLASSTLHVSLTHQAFLRTTDAGESVFINAVLFATRRPAFVRAMKATLTRTDKMKVYPLKLIHLGQPVDRGTPTSDHLFFSRSAIDLVPIDQPLRRIYMLVIADYCDKMQAAAAALKSDLSKFRPEIAEFKTLVDKQEQAAKAKLLEERTRPHQEEFVRAMMEAVQVEAGKYRLDVEYEYRDAQAPTNRTRTARSSISFVVAEGVRDRVRAQLSKSSEGLAGHTLLDAEIAAVWPEVELSQIKVLGSDEDAG